MTSGIYWFYQPSQDRAIYVGSSANVEGRLLKHRWLLKNGKHYNTRLQRTWDKYGEDDIEMTLLEPVDREQLVKREQFWMDFMPSWPTCNVAIAADSPFRGLKHTDRARQKIAAAHLGKKRAVGEKRQPCSEERKKKISLANSGKKSRLGLRHTEETRHKLSVAHTGLRHTAEAKAKMSASRLGKKRGPYKKQAAQD